MKEGGTQNKRRVGGMRRRRGGRRRGLEPQKEMKERAGEKLQRTQQQKTLFALVYPDS